jgi:hypothetical protein
VRRAPEPFDVGGEIHGADTGKTTGRGFWTQYLYT